MIQQTQYQEFAESPIDHRVDEWDTLESLNEIIQSIKSEGKSIRVIFSEKDQLRDEVKVHEHY
jgi:hypothetical protein